MKKLFGFIVITLILALLMSCASDNITDPNDEIDDEIAEKLPSDITGGWGNTDNN